MKAEVETSEKSVKELRFRCLYRYHGLGWCDCDWIECSLYYLCIQSEKASIRTKVAEEITMSTQVVLGPTENDHFQRYNCRRRVDEYAKDLRAYRTRSPSSLSAYCNSIHSVERSPSQRRSWQDIRSSCSVPRLSARAVFTAETFRVLRRGVSSGHPRSVDDRGK